MYIHVDMIYMFIASIRASVIGAAGPRRRKLVYIYTFLTDANKLFFSVVLFKTKCIRHFLTAVQAVGIGARDHTAYLVRSSSQFAEIREIPRNCY
jgi:hypothetical protein